MEEIRVGDYRVENENGESLRITTPDGEDFADDLGDPRFCSLIVDATKLESERRKSFFGYPLRERSIFFFDKNELIKFIKSKQILIYAESRFVVFRRLNVGDSLQIGRHTFHNLLSCSYRTVGDHVNGWPDVVADASRLWVSAPLYSELNNDILTQSSDFRNLVSIPNRRTFVYLDVSDYSMMNPGIQALVIRTLLYLSGEESLWATANSRFGEPIRPESQFCIGDGYIFAFKRVELGVYFAAFLAYLIEFVVSHEFVVPFHFRIGVHTGSVLCFWDPGRDGWNYTGDGINGGNRVLNAIGKDADDIVFLSSEVRSSLINKNDEMCKSIIRHTQNRGRRSDKHGTFWRVYELDHSGLVMNDLPDETSFFL